MPLDPVQAADTPRMRRPVLDALIRDNWEVLAALGIMIAVLGSLDLGWLRSPLLLLSAVPLLFLMTCAVAGLTWRLVLLWLLSCVALAALLGDWVYAGLGYPAVGGALLLGIQRMRGPSRAQ